MRAAWWWIDRWRKSTAYTDMSLAEQGAYRNLLDELWLRGGLLPLEDRILGKIAGDATAWGKVRAVVMARFVETPEGWRNDTHDEVAAQTAEAIERQREKGKRRASQASRGPAGTFQPVQPDNQPRNQPETSRASSHGTSLPTPDPDPDQTPDPTPTPEPKKKVPSEPIALTAETCAKALKAKTGSSLTPCRSQVAALLKAPGWTIPRVLDAIEAQAAPGMAPWDFVRLVTGQNGNPRGGMTPQQILDYGRSREAPP